MEKTLWGRYYEKIGQKELDDSYSLHSNRLGLDFDSDYFYARFYYN